MMEVGDTPLKKTPKENKQTHTADEESNRNSHGENYCGEHELHVRDNCLSQSAKEGKKKKSPDNEMERGGGRG